jgi:hypothetical protein
MMLDYAVIPKLLDLDKSLSNNNFDRLLRRSCPSSATAGVTETA